MLTVRRTEAHLLRTELQFVSEVADLIVHISGKIQILEVQFQKEVLSLQSIRLMKHRGITIFLPETGIIAALSDGLLVMEAGKKSGSLITANLAAEQGKTIFALLGNNSPQNEGSNALIKEGLAIPVTDFMDILCEFDSLYATTDDEFDIDNISLADTGNFPVKGIRKQAPARIYVNKQNDQQPAKTAVPYVSEKSETVVQKPVHKENLNLPKTAQDVYEYIGNEPVHIDKISADLKIPVFKVLTALTMLEMKDLVSALQGRNYILK